MNHPKNSRTLHSAHRAGSAVVAGALGEVGDAWNVPATHSSASESVGPVSEIAAPQRHLTTDRFIERGVIGVGGMSLVLRAFDTELQRDVAVKLLMPECDSDGAAIARLIAEARTTGFLEHPHIPPVYGLGTDDRGVHFFWMKLVNGETLEDRLKWNGLGRLDPVTLRELLDVYLQVCAAVSFAHDRGVLHRDLKPANLMISAFDEAYVIDWGVARRDGPGEGPATDAFPSPDATFVGTPSYMAPEQLWSLQDQVTERTDVFGLGAVLYQILTGRPPQDRESIARNSLRKTDEAIPSPARVVRGATVPPELSRIAMKAMSHEATDRYPSVRALAVDIEQFLTGFSA